MGCLANDEFLSPESGAISALVAATEGAGDACLSRAPKTSGILALTTVEMSGHAGGSRMRTDHTSRWDGEATVVESVPPSRPAPTRRRATAGAGVKEAPPKPRATAAPRR